MTNPLSLFFWIVFTVFTAGFLGFRSGILIGDGDLFTFDNAVIYFTGLVTSLISSMFVIWVVTNLSKKD